MYLARCIAWVCIISLFSCLVAEVDVNSNRSSESEEQLSDAMLMTHLPWLAESTPSTTCLTEQEKTLAKYVQARKDRVSSGDLDHMIEIGTYTADSLSMELLTWWANEGLGNINSAIQEFELVMHYSMNRAPGSKFAEISLGIVNVIKAGLTAFKEVDPLIITAVDAIQKALQTLVKELDTSAPDFLSAATHWRANLPTRSSTSYYAIDEFIHEVRRDPSHLRDAYEFATILISSTVSFRYAFNSYYMSFLANSIPLPFNDVYFTSVLDYGTGAYSDPGTLWIPSPRGMAPCYVANRVLGINNRCAGPDVPGMLPLPPMLSSTPSVSSSTILRGAFNISDVPDPDTYMDYKAMLWLDDGSYWLHKTRGLQYSCSDLHTVEYCWISGKRLQPTDAECVKLQRWLRKNHPANLFPYDNEHIMDRCENFITPSSDIRACQSENTDRWPCTEHPEECKVESY